MSKVKICGLTRFEDVRAVNAVLPDFCGFVFAEGSRRRVDAKLAAALRAELDPRVEAVGVFVNQDPEWIAELYGQGIIKIAQLHGDEDAQYMRHLKELCGCSIIKALGVGKALPLSPGGADFLLFDTFGPARGGTGRPFDWTPLDGYTGSPYFLAGGLTPENAADAVTRLNPYCVDVSSGVETDGKKDRNKIANFVSRVKLLSGSDDID